MMNENDTEHEDNITPHDENDPLQENPLRPDIESTPQLTGSANDISSEHQYWIDRGEIDELRSRWTTIQAQFVDQPCTAIEQGDALVTETIEKMQASLADLHSHLRERWNDNPDSSTEDLRLVLQEYRSLFTRLLDQ